MNKRKTANIGDELTDSMREALAHTRGEKVGVHETKFKVPALEVKRIRQKVGLTQDNLAVVMGVSVSGIRKWEQGRRQPHGAARTLLRVMDKEPEVVARVPVSAL